MDALNLFDPEQKAAAMEEFVNRYPFCAKALSIAQAQLRDLGGATFISSFCNGKMRRHGVTLEPWDQFVKNTEKDAAPPKGFAKSISLSEPR
jgi:hypothetical protein